jgi:hypothetical protein
MTADGFAFGNVAPAFSLRSRTGFRCHCRLPRGIFVALNQPASNLDRHVEFRHILDAGRDRHQGAQQLPLLFVA